MVLHPWALVGCSPGTLRYLHADSIPQCDLISMMPPIDSQDVSNDSYGPAVHCLPIWLPSQDLGRHIARCTTSCTKLVICFSRLGETKITNHDFWVISGTMEKGKRKNIIWWLVLFVADVHIHNIIIYVAILSWCATVSLVLDLV